MALRLGVDPRHADQMVRGTVVLPHGTGKSARVVVFATGEKIKEAEDAGADHVGGPELAKKISDGWLDFDAVVSTPDMMKEVGKLGRVLGPRGLMPNPKTGTVTFDVGGAVQQIKAGKVEFRVEKAGIVHAPFGKASFATDQLQENAEALVAAIFKARAGRGEGQILQVRHVCRATMGPGVIGSTKTRWCWPRPRGRDQMPLTRQQEKKVDRSEHLSGRGGRSATYLPDGLPGCHRDRGHPVPPPGPRSRRVAMKWSRTGSSCVPSMASALAELDEQFQGPTARGLQR